jgi:hypothetical protein
LASSAARLFLRQVADQSLIYVMADQLYLEAKEGSYEESNVRYLSADNYIFTQHNDIRSKRKS